MLHTHAVRTFSSCRLFTTISWATWQRTVDQPGIAELLAAGRPAFSYGKLGHRHWLYAVGTAAGVEPETLGQTSRSWASSRLALAKAGLTNPDGQLDVVALDDYARTAGCDAAKAAAVNAREARVAERMAAVIASRECRAGAARGLAKVFKLTGRPLERTAKEPPGKPGSKHSGPS